MAEADATLHIRPSLRPRMEFLLTALVMAAIAGVCGWMAVTRGREILAPGSTLQLGGLEPFKHILVGAVWAVAACSGLLALWSLWAVGNASRRFHIVIDERSLEWRPYIGLRQRVELSSVRAVEDLPGGRFVGPHLALSWGRRRKPLKLFRKWYLPLDYQRIRQRMNAALNQAAVAEQPAKALAEAGPDHTAAP